MDEFEHIAEVAEPQGGRRDHHMQCDGAGMASASRMAGPFAASAGPWKAMLERVIQAEVLPRLMLSHVPRREQAAGREPAHGASHGVQMSGRLDDFVALLLKPEADAALAYVEALQGDGPIDQSVFLDLLAPAARRLGLLWDDDRCDFMEVTVGLQRLHQILRLLSRGESALASDAPLHNRVLLLPAPGETHVFGVAIVEKFFSDAGWDVTRSNEKDFMGALEGSWFDVVGFSLSHDGSIDKLQRAIAGARKRSVNRDLRILVGGPVFLDRPELARKVGADAMAADAPSAVLWARNLLNRQILV